MAKMKKSDKLPCAACGKNTGHNLADPKTVRIIVYTRDTTKVYGICEKHKQKMILDLIIKPS